MSLNVSMPGGGTSSAVTCKLVRSRIRSRTEEALEYLIEVDTRLLERNRINILQPTTLPRLLGHRQQLLDVMPGAQRLAMNAITMGA
ncbi:MAG: hypothetical protein RI841_14110 [Halomonas sp.]|nr:hypothetical protein [Halomonas sp.]